jgi:hypothetical protein
MKLHNFFDLLPGERLHVAPIQATDQLLACTICREAIPRWSPVFALFSGTERIAVICARCGEAYR